MAARKQTPDEILKEHIARDESRLDRIESKIDKLAETMVSLARAEEKLISLETDRVTINERLNKHSDRLDNVEIKVDRNLTTISVITKVFWICITAFAGVAAVQYYIS